MLPRPAAPDERAHKLIPADCLDLGRTILAPPDHGVPVRAGVEATHCPPPPVVLHIEPVDPDPRDRPVPRIDLDALEPKSDPLPNRLGVSLLDSPQRREELGLDAPPRASEREALGVGELTSAPPELGSTWYDIESSSSSGFEGRSITSTPTSAPSPCTTARRTYAPSWLVLKSSATGGDARYGLPRGPAVNSGWVGGGTTPEHRRYHVGRRRPATEPDVSVRIGALTNRIALMPELADAVLRALGEVVEETVERLPSALSDRGPSHPRGCSAAP